jgi:hypothetical protein
MTDQEQQKIDDQLDDEHWAEELREIQEQEEEQMYIEWQASMYSY